jgi:hypothetical protein
MNKLARSNRRESMVSLAHEDARQRRGGSKVHRFIPVGLSASQKLLERLEAENAQLRHTVAELMLEIQASREGIQRAL